jgi:hypothetical protein
MSSDDFEAISARVRAAQSRVTRGQRLTREIGGLAVMGLVSTFLAIIPAPAVMVIMSLLRGNPHCGGASFIQARPLVGDWRVDAVWYAATAAFLNFFILGHVQLTGAGSRPFEPKGVQFEVVGIWAGRFLTLVGIGFAVYFNMHGNRICVADSGIRQRVTLNGERHYDWSDIRGIKFHCTGRNGGDAALKLSMSGGTKLDLDTMDYDGSNDSREHLSRILNGLGIPIGVGGGLPYCLKYFPELKVPRMVCAPVGQYVERCRKADLN